MKGNTANANDDDAKRRKMKTKSVLMLGGSSKEVDAGQNDEDRRQGVPKFGNVKRDGVVDFASIVIRCDFGEEPRHRSPLSSRETGK